MNNELAQTLNKTSRRSITSVLIFWCGYVAITLFVGVATSSIISNEILQLTAWGLISSGGLIALSLFLKRSEMGPKTNVSLKVRASSWRGFFIGLLLGVVTFGIHVAIVSAFAGPIRFEFVSGVGVLAALIFFCTVLIHFLYGGAGLPWLSVTATHSNIGAVACGLVDGPGLWTEPLSLRLGCADNYARCSSGRRALGHECDCDKRSCYAYRASRGLELRELVCGKPS